MELPTVTALADTAGRAREVFQEVTGISVIFSEALEAFRDVSKAELPARMKKALISRQLLIISEAAITERL